jgi:hypothetical protein
VGGRGRRGRACVGGDMGYPSQRGAGSDRELGDKVGTCWNWELGTAGNWELGPLGGAGWANK